MPSFRKVVGAVVVFAGVALGWGQGPSEARADGCMLIAPDCEATMGLCGSTCSSCLPIVEGEWTYPEDWCDDMCADYGGTRNYVSSTAGSWPVDYLNITCMCAWECPYYYE